MTMSEWKWTDWIAHDDKGFPAALEPDEIVLAQLEDDYVLNPMPAVNIDWHHPGDSVIRYKRREYFDKTIAFSGRSLETV
jgi:hypothetical protein